MKKKRYDFPRLLVKKMDIVNLLCNSVYDVKTIEWYQGDDQEDDKGAFWEEQLL